MKYMMIMLAACMEGRNRFTEIMILCGEGGNGKGLLLDLMANTFGKLHGTMDPAFFQASTKPGSTSGPIPDVAKNKWCRSLTCSEPNGDVPWAA